LTEDHRIAVNSLEAARLTAKNSLPAGAVSHRLYGLNIARMLGDRFLKEADVGFTAEPYVSEGVALNPEDEVLVIMASDGLWDVVSQEKVATMAAKVATAAGTDGSCRSRETVAGPHHQQQQQQQQQEMVAEGCSSSSSSSVGPGKRSVAAAVADALMHAALTLRSKDDISIMVLHVLPADAAAARSNVQCRMSASGSM